MITQTGPQIEAFNVERTDRVLRVHEVWSRFGGRNRFRCGGRCVTGPANVDFRYNVFAWAAITAPTLLELAVCGQWLLHVSPLLPVITIALLVCTWVMMLLTACTDPGIIPRPELQAMVPGMESEVAKAMGCEGTSLHARHFDAKVMEMLHSQGFSWCNYCSMVRPPKAKHCRDCDVCVLESDHHCPFVNNCIGKRNYRYFCGFILSLSCLGVAVFSGMTMWVLSHRTRSAGLDKKWQTLSIVLICAPSAICLVLVLALGCFHIGLIAMGRTTREVMTGRVQGDFRVSFFGDRGPSLVCGRREVRRTPYSDMEDAFETMESTVTAASDQSAETKS